MAEEVGLGSRGTWEKEWFLSFLSFPYFLYFFVVCCRLSIDGTTNERLKR
jgi:hypothetical protein